MEDPAKCIFGPDEVALKWPKNKIAATAKVARRKVPFAHTLPKTNYLEFSHRSQKDYWQGLCHELETSARRKYKSDRIRNYDLSVTLPPELYERVSKIVPLPPIEEDTFEEKTKVDVVPADIVVVKSKRELKDDEESFNESTCSDIIRKEQAFSTFELKLEKKIDRKNLKKYQTHNWFSSFVCKKQKERIKWDSKIYRLEKNIWEKPLYDQAEELMDAAAERFTEWLNALGSTTHGNMSKDLLKSLFSIETGAGLLSGIHIEPKQVNAVPTTVADRWNVPEMAIELKLQKSILERNKNIPKDVHTVAFGRTLPNSMRPWQPSEMDKPIEPVFPAELLTREKVFKGIAHLRSTKALIDFYQKRTDVDRPKFLVENGHFGAQSRRVSRVEIPLYEMLNLK